jgi:hypothetical protein
MSSTNNPLIHLFAIRVASVLFPARSLKNNNITQAKLDKNKGEITAILKRSTDLAFLHDFWADVDFRKNQLLQIPGKMAIQIRRGCVFGKFW